MVVLCQFGKHREGKIWKTEHYPGSTGEQLCAISVSMRGVPGKTAEPSTICYECPAGWYGVEDKDPTRKHHTEFSRCIPSEKNKFSNTMKREAHNCPSKTHFVQVARVQCTECAGAAVTGRGARDCEVARRSIPTVSVTEGCTALSLVQVLIVAHLVTAMGVRNDDGVGMVGE